MFITRISIKYPVFATMLMLAFLVLGLFSIKKLPVDKLPDISFPLVIIQTSYDGASPQAVEQLITNKIEGAVNTVSGIKRITSRSYEGNSVVTVEFDLSIDPRKAAEDIREKVALIRGKLPEDVLEPKVARFNQEDEPIWSIALTDERSSSLEKVSLYAKEQLKKQIENIQGVGNVALIGLQIPELRVSYNLADIQRFNLSIAQINQAIISQTKQQPIGSIYASQQWERVVQIAPPFKNTRDLQKLVVGSFEANPVLLGQVAALEEKPATPDSVALLNGKRVVALDILKARGENTIALVDKLNKMVEKLKLPNGVKLTLVRDGSLEIRNSVNNVKETLIEGALLTILIVFLFLGSWRSTIITGLTLPISIIGTFWIMKTLGFTLNVLTLLALSISVGFLIDDAIVVRENIMRHLGMGKSSKQAALEGTQEIGLAVIATTASIVAVFLPIGFMDGMIGKFFFQFGLTIAFAVILSMLVSFTLDPMLSSIWHDPQADGKEGKPAFKWFQNGLLRLEITYVKLVRWGLNHRKTIVMLTLGSFIGAFFLFKLVGSEFLPETDNNELAIRFYTQASSRLEHTETKVKQIEAILKKVPDIQNFYSKVNSGFAAGKNYASIFLKLHPKNKRNRSISSLKKEIRALTASIGGIVIMNISTPDGSKGGEKPISLSVQGENRATLEKIANRLSDDLKNIKGIVDVDKSNKSLKPLYEVELDAYAQNQLNGNGVILSWKQLLNHQEIASWTDDNGRVWDIRIALPEALQNEQGLNQLLFPNDSGSLQQHATIKKMLAAPQINHRDLRREVNVSANLQETSAGQIQPQIDKVIAKIPLPEGYQIKVGGESKDIGETMGYALSALGLAVIFIYLILASQFNRFLQPLAIMISLPLSLIGVALALFLWQSTLNMFSMIGFIMLMGLVTKNAILLVDAANQHQNQYQLGIKAALEYAAQLRLRPILMTTTAMIAGMMPLALGLGEGVEQRAPLAHAVIGGVITSTLLTLVVVPVMVYYLERKENRW